MKKITMGNILNTLCDELGLTVNTDRPIKYQTFKRAMLSSDLFTTENAIKIRWEQLLCTDSIIKSRGLDGKGNLLIYLDMNGVYQKIRIEGLTPCFSLTLSHTASEEESQ